MSPGYPYQQPMYAPPQNLSPPGTLVIPPSNAPLYNPSNGGSTYEADPKDDWQPGTSGSGSGMFDSEPGGVPTPKDPGGSSPFYQDNLNGPSTEVQPATEIEDAKVAAASDPAPSAGTNARAVSYGFDTAGFRWIQGVLNYHPETSTWSVTYNRSQDDPFMGDLTLVFNRQPTGTLQPGTAVQVRGQLDKDNLDSRGRATYRVEAVYELPIAVARLN